MGIWASIRRSLWATALVVATPVLAHIDANKLSSPTQETLTQKPFLLTREAKAGDCPAMARGKGGVGLLASTARINLEKSKIKPSSQIAKTKLHKVIFRVRALPSKTQITSKQQSKFPVVAIPYQLENLSWLVNLYPIGQSNNFARNHYFFYNTSNFAYRGPPVDTKSLSFYSFFSFLVSFFDLNLKKTAAFCLQQESTTVGCPTQPANLFPNIQKLQLLTGNFSWELVFSTTQQKQYIPPEKSWLARIFSCGSSLIRIPRSVDILLPLNHSSQAFLASRLAMNSNFDRLLKELH